MTRNLAWLYLLILCVCGCASASAPSPFTGNWILSGEVLEPRLLDQFGNPVYQKRTSYAYLVQNGTSVSGSLQDNFCTYLPQSYLVSGTIDGGDIQLSGEAQNLVGLRVPEVRMSASASPFFQSIGGIIFHPAGCPVQLYLPPVAFTGQRVPSLVGSWTGMLQPASGAPFRFSLSLSNPGIGFSGDSTLSGFAPSFRSSCFPPDLSFYADQVGADVTAVVITTNGTIEIDGQLPLSGPGNSLSVRYSIQGGTCNGDYGGGTLSK